MPLPRCLPVAVLLVVLAAAWPGRAAEALPPSPLPPPAGEVILTVIGRIARTNDGAVARFDRALLEGLGQDRLRTTTPWTEGEAEFAGVLGSRLVDELGAEGERLRLRALNDYQAVIPLEGLRRYPILLASRQDGQALSVRERGPVWVVYPWSGYPELDTPVHRQRSVWQVAEITVE